MTRLAVFRQYFRQEKYGQNRFKKLSKFQKFQLSNFTLTWSNEGKVNRVRLGITYSKELEQKMKMLDKSILKNI